MSVLGWNDVPEEAFAKFDFWKCPTWIRALARVPIIEIFAYPLIVKKGFATIWIPKNFTFETGRFESKGWNVRIGEPDDAQRLLDGSIARLSTKAIPIRPPRTSFTRWGRELAWQKSVHVANGTLKSFEDSKQS
jgi:hypothetical protein